ncbi:RNA-dependent RNA polymerase 2 [Trichonephila inaurata madagascariensis]|uniref:RNA-dependent RNA polymerase n=1 Tax=Trichonephila inaurata madagascariensis TaxID=2747483 RepID=A0A8X6JE50_9ARAC|nr:RNA-dependent RNA polymerase 2 [Trichonephila inaurata madagascariensis]
MTQVNFRIIIIPKSNEDPDLNIFKRYVQACGLVVQSLERVELDKAKQPGFEEILEFIIDVKARSSTDSNKVNLYKNLIIYWNRVTKNIHDARPMLQLSHDECFLRKRVSCHSNLKLQNISFGVQARLGEYIAYSTLCENSTANFIHDMKELKIEAPSTVTNDFLNITIKVKSLTISYSKIRNIIVSIDNETFDLYLDLLHPPLFYEEITDGLSCYSKFYRVLPFDAEILMVGKSHVLRLNFPYINDFFLILSCLRYRCGKIPIHFIAMNVIHKLPPHIPPIHFTHFGCTYMWAAVVHRTFLIHEQSINITESQNKLLRYSLANGDCLEKVLSKIIFLIDSGRFLNYWDIIDKLYFHLNSGHDNSFKSISIPEKCRLIRRIVITPTRMMMFPPDLMCENRILRNFDSEFFLRVTFRDDDFLPMNIRMYEDSVFLEVVKKPINSGIKIGERHYKILAWSSSQLREHGVSMYAKDSNGFTASDIRNWTEIDPRTTMNIPKCLARIGQCFSQTEETLHVPLNNMHVKFERDIENGFNPNTYKPYTFSDGIGRISKGLIKKVSKTIPRGQDCSAFQIRYGGCKGMLVIDPTLNDVDIVFRESMRKFDCKGIAHTKLEIVKKSSPIPLRLNRPFIAILHDMGVEPRIFLRMQEIMLQNLIDMLLEEEKAAHYLNSQTAFSAIKFKDLSRSGICLTIEPFFRTLLLSLQRYYIDIIKTKANVDIDPAYGRNMFGVLDETGILQYGQVFVQYSSDVTDFLLTSKTERVADFLVNYIKKDTIGSIALAHLAFADQFSVHEDICLEIARKHAIAVDFAKTGVSERLARHENPKQFPDFMEKFWKKKYKSKKALGKMYRVSRDFDTDNQSYILQYNNVEIDPALVVEGWEKYKASAINSRNEYNNCLKTILQTYGISHETEAFGGSFLKLHARFNERRDRADIVNLVQTWIRELVDKTRKEFFRDVNASTNANRIVDDMERKASAWYIVTYGENNPEFLSFPWVVSEIFVDIKILSPCVGRINNIAPLTLKFEKEIIENANAGMLPSLNPDAKLLLNSLYFLCDPIIVERAVSLLSKWADEEKIISLTYEEGKFLYYETFIKLIIYVAESENYVSRELVRSQKEFPSTAALCISFFKYCMKLRFLSKQEVKAILPFQVYNDRILAKVASQAFHTIVVTGNFSCLCYHEYLYDAPEIVDMKVVSIDSSIFGESPIEESKLRNAESALQQFSGVEHVLMRENCQREKIIVDGKGSVTAIKRLKGVLFKRNEVLIQFFTTGTLPE